MPRREGAGRCVFSARWSRSCGRRGTSAGALRLEDLWNALAERHAFRLFCAYPIECVRRAEPGAAESGLPAAILTSSRRPAHSSGQPVRGRSFRRRLQSVRSWKTSRAPSFGSQLRLLLRWRRGRGDAEGQRRPPIGRRKLRPRVMVDVSSIDTSTTFLGTPVPFPVGLAPTSQGSVRASGWRRWQPRALRWRPA